MCSQVRHSTLINSIIIIYHLLTLALSFSCPAGSESRSRLRGLVSLRLSGLDMSDSVIKTMVRHMPSLRQLDLSYCQGLTDQSINLLTAAGCNTRNTLRQLNLSGTLHIIKVLNLCKWYFRCWGVVTHCDWSCKNKTRYILCLVKHYTLSHLVYYLYNIILSFSTDCPIFNTY